MDTGTLPGGNYHAFAKAVADVKGEDVVFEGDINLGEVIGSMYVRRMSAPYEQTIKFWEIVGDPDHTAVDYEGKSLLRVKKEFIERLMDEADNLKAVVYGNTAVDTSMN